MIEELNISEKGNRVAFFDFTSSLNNKIKHSFESPQNEEIVLNKLKSFKTFKIKKSILNIGLVVGYWNNV